MGTVSAPVLLAAILLILTPSGGCSMKATIDQTADTTSNVTGTTSSVRSWMSEDGLLRPDYKALALIAANRENVEQDMAAGSGEYLTAVGALLGVPDTNRASFGAAVQTRYSEDRPDDHATPEQWLARLQDTARFYRPSH